MSRKLEPWQHYLRLPHQPPPLGFRPAAARAPAGDGTVKERHRRPGQVGHPQLQGPRHREQNGQLSVRIFIVFLFFRKYHDIICFNLVA